MTMTEEIVFKNKDNEYIIICSFHKFYPLERYFLLSSKPLYEYTMEIPLTGIKELLDFIVDNKEDDNIRYYYEKEFNMLISSIPEIYKHMRNNESVILMITKP